MPASVALVLDTTAPTATWGAQTGTTAGALLQLAYTADETIDSAELVLSDRTLALTVDPSILSVLLPADTPDGPASVTVVDDVGNPRTYPALVTISGTIIIVPPATRPQRGAPPRRTRRPRSTVIRTHVTILTRTESRLRARLHWRVTVPPSTATTATASLVHAIAYERTATARLRSHVGQSTAALAGHELAVHRRDGPDFEELLLLGIL